MKSKELESFSKRFEAILKVYKLNNSQAARKINISRQVIEHCIKGSEIRYGTLISIIEAFPEVDIKWLLMGKTDTPEKKDSEYLKTLNDLVVLSILKKTKTKINELKQNIEDVAQELSDINNDSKQRKLNRHNIIINRNIAKIKNNR